jgi:heme exporter protein D
MRPVQLFALISGVLYVGIGVMGFIPGLVSHPAAMPGYVEAVGSHGGFGYLMGLFPINTAHNIVHLVVGAVGILTSIALDSARYYSGLLAVFYGLLTIMGLIPVANTTFGLIPIYGNDVWLHAGTTLLAIYFGFIATPNLRDQLVKEAKAKQQQEASQSS